MRNFSSIALYVGLSLVFMIGFLWHLLGSGYVILLDWIAGPVPLLHFASVDEMANVPVNVLLFLLGNVLPGWAVQKGILALLGFLLLFVPLWISLFRSFYARLFVALLIGVNPFVYERLLAGQWRVVVGYLFVYVLIVLLLRTSPNYKHIFGTLLFCGFFSMHFLVIGCIITGVWFLLRLFSYGDAVSRKIFSLTFLRAFGIFFVLSLYWVVPFVLSHNTSDVNDLASRFGSSHWEAFATVGETRWGPVINVLLFHGFWLEGRDWSEDFLIASRSALFLYGMSLLYGLAMIGLITSRGDRWTDSPGQGLSPFGKWFLVVCFWLAFVFSLGLSATPFEGINRWLFENVSLWNGFRDSQKWSGVLVVVVALLGGKGLCFLQNFVSGRSPVGQGICGWIFLPLAFVITPHMMLGFSSQVSVTDYPSEWYGARASLVEYEKQSPCTIVFLPWHQYYRLDHNGGALSANVSARFFPCEVVSGRDTGLGDIGTDYSRARTDYALIDELVRGNDDRSEVIDAVVASLRASGITHIVFTDDLLGSDVYRYPFLTHESVREIFGQGGVQVFELN